MLRTMAEKDTRSEMDLVRQQIAELQIASAEKSKPWYREPSSFLSLVAIVASIITFVISQGSQEVQDVRARKEQLETLLTNLLALQTELADSAKTISDPLDFERHSAMLNQKNLIYLEEAELLVDQLGNNVSSSEYNALASDMLMNSNFKMAEAYFARGVGAAKDDLSRAIAFRSLAQFYFMPSQFRNFDLGRKTFQESVDAMKDSQGDDYSKYVVGFTYEAWGWAEKSNGFPDEGGKMLERAQKFYTDLSVLNPLRQRALQSYFSRMNPQPMPNDPSGFVPNLVK
jgi:hypothetical protein